MTGIVYGKSELAVVAEANHLRRLEGWVIVSPVLYNPNSLARPYAVQIAKPKLIDEC